MIRETTMKTNMLPRFLLLPATLLALFAFGIGSAEAATLLWTNALSGNWNNAANWSPNAIPGSSDTALITNNGNYTVTLDVSPTVNSLTLGGASGTQIFFAASRTLTI